MWFFLLIKNNLALDPENLDPKDLRKKEMAQLLLGIYVIEIWIRESLIFA